MAANRLLLCVVLSLVFLGACDGGSGSSQNSDDSAKSPADDAVQPSEYDMPPLVEVIPPGVDFVPACENIIPPEDIEPLPAEENTVTGGDTGFLVDSAVSGVPYETRGLRARTGLDGEFQYEKGDTVRFLLGDTLLGEVTGQAQITPFDLAESAVITGMSAITAALEDENHPFQTVINIAVLLQSLDQDANPVNAIEITPDIANLFQGASLDLGQHWQTFPQEIGLRQAITQANANSLFSVTHGDLNPAPAIQHLYQTLGIDAGTIGLSLEQYDEGGDGTPEESSSWLYDINGNVTRIESSGSDGRLRGVENWTYDAWGNRTRYEREEYGQQSTESEQYDILGNLTSRQADEDGDSINDIDETWRYQFGPAGELTRVVREDSLATSQEGTGSITTYEYDAAGKLIRVESSGDGLERTAVTLSIPVVQYLELARTYTVTSKYDADGVLAEDVRIAFNSDIGRNTVTAKYDAQGNVTSYEGRIKQFNSSQPDITTMSSYQYEYDSNNRITRKTSDEDGDGKPDQIERYAYDARGNVTRELTDWDANGSTDQITTYEYDIYNNVTLLEQDNDADGTVDESQSWPYHYVHDAQGNVVRRVLDQSGDGRPNEIVGYAYHANGSLAQEDRWSTEDSEHNVRTWQYDALGNLTLEELDHDANGTVDSTVNFEYDACSYPKLRQMRDAENSITSVESWQHDTQGQLRRYDWDTGQFWIDDMGDLPPPFDTWQSEGFEGWQYDAKDQLIRYQLECRGDCVTSFFDPLDSQVVNYEYDSNGNKTRELTDRDGDRQPDLVLFYEYDARDNVTRELGDTDGDGEADWATSHQYNNNDQVTRRENDEDGDGLPDTIENFEYDQHGNITLESYDGGADGTPDSTTTFEYQYDANGKLVRSREEVDWDANGKPEYINYREYDSKGNLTRYEEDQDADGTLDAVETWQYDASGNLVRQESDWAGDGTPDLVRSYRYDEEGQLTRETEADDWDEDGSPDQIITRHYVPTGWGHIFYRGDNP